MLILKALKITICSPQTATVLFCLLILQVFRIHSVHCEGMSHDSCMSGDINTSMGNVGMHLNDLEISVVILVVFTPLH